MVRSRSMFALMGAAVAGLVGALALPQAASAAEEVVPEPRIAAVMAEVPGGVLLGENRAVWPALGMEMETPSAGLSVFAVGGCATGYVCVFDAANASGAKISWSSCGNPSVSSFTVRSIANARAGGYAQARYGTTVRATAHAGGYANVFSSVNNVRCVA